MHYRFHVNVLARPMHAAPGPAVVLDGRAVPTLRDADGAPLVCDASFPMSFEQALAALEQLPRFDAEPDGFFVLAGEADGRHWHVSGHLFDYDERLYRVELNGHCPRASFDALLACLGWPTVPLAFALVEQGVVLDEPAFRDWASHVSTTD